MMLKRILCFMLSIILPVSLAACGGSDPTEPTPAPTQAVTAAPTEESTGNSDDGSIDLTAFIREFRRDAAIEEQVVYDAEGVTVTATGIRYDSITGAAILLSVQNTTGEDLLVQMAAAAVNGYMMEVDFSLAVDAEKSAEGEMVVPYTALALANLDVIATVELSVQLVDRSNYEVLTDCEPVVILTTAAADHEQTYDESGQIAWDANGVKIVIKGVDTGRRIADESVLIVYLYNGSENAVSIQSANVTVNGYEMTSAMTATVLPGKHAMDVVTFFDPDLEEHDIQQIDTVDIRFRIFDAETWTVIAETPLISVEL